MAGRADDERLAPHFRHEDGPRGRAIQQCASWRTAFVEPPGAGLVAAGPGVPVDDEPPGQGPAGEGGEQALDLRHGQRDRARLGGRRLIGPDWGRCLGVGAVTQEGGGDGADGQGGHDEHGVAGDRGVQPGLALVEAEAVLAEFEIFFYCYVGS